MGTGVARYAHQKSFTHSSPSPHSPNTRTRIPSTCLNRILANIIYLFKFRLTLHRVLVSHKRQIIRSYFQAACVIFSINRANLPPFSPRTIGAEFKLENFLLICYKTSRVPERRYREVPDSFRII